MSLEEMNQEQVRSLLKHIDATQSEDVKASIFGHLGRECFTTHGLDRWIGQYQGDVQAYLDRVNVQQESKYWEKLEFNEDGTALILTGRIVEGCACAFASGPQPLLSLCKICCKHFQEEFFHTLLGKNVDVEITEAYMLGGERCSTIIHILER